MTFVHKILIFILFGLLSCTVGCARKESAVTSDEQVLVQFGDSVLTLSAVEQRIPRGIDPEDSLQMFHNIVNSWVSSLVLEEVARENISDMDRIDRMTSAYRNSLIVDEYLNRMAEKSTPQIQESQIKSYYEAHKDEFVLGQPIVKGAMIRVDENDGNLPDLRKWLNAFTDDAFDKIERSGLRKATAYEYFRDEWRQWSDVADRIPYRFFDADAFLASTKNFETNADGSVYLLHISEYIPSGKEMPYEFARLKIMEILRAAEINKVRNNVKRDIYLEMSRDGRLKAGLYDPVKGEMIKK